MLPLHIVNGKDQTGVPKLDDCAQPDDNTDLNASTSRHGLLPKLSGTLTEFLSGDGTWRTPTGTVPKLDDCNEPDDNTDLDATTSKHGLLPKLGGGTTNFLRADGTWADPVASVAKCTTGQYTGDGSTGQGITGVGFAPKAVFIFEWQASEVDSIVILAKLDQSMGDIAYLLWANNYTRDNRINSLDADGFTVDDDGSDAHPNKNGQVYIYLALG